METDAERRRRYDRIADGCKACKNFKPKTRNQCTIYKLLLRQMEPDLVRQERCFIKDGIECKGFTLNG